MSDISFDDFFVPATDNGIEETVTALGKSFKIWVKKGVSLGEREAAKAKAITTHISPKGELVVDGFNQGVFTLEMMHTLLKRWELPKQLTRDNIAALVPEVGDAIQTVLQKYIVPDKQEALVPFGNPSDNQ